MRYVEATSDYKIQEGEVSVFLAGGISNSQDWQNEAVICLSKFELPNTLILNPRRKFYQDTLAESRRQIIWEFFALAKASIVLFWFSPETLCPITLFEYGKYLTKNTPLVVGCDPKYKRTVDIILQTKLERPSLHVYRNLVTMIEHDLVPKIYTVKG